MNVNDIYGSNYLKCSDLQGRNVVVTISGVEAVPMNDGKIKLCLSFQGKEKRMLLNITNSNNIAAIYSPETDHWIGQKIMLVPTMVDYQGKSVDAIRIRAPGGNVPNVKASPAVNQNWQAPPQAAPQPDQQRYVPASQDMLDDAVPF